MKDVGEKMSIGITAPIVAGGAALLKGAIDAEVATGKLQASLGLTAKEAENLGGVAQDVWKNGFGENIDEANQAIVSVRKNIGDLSKDDLQKVTEGAMTIADVFGQDVNEVTAAAGVAMKNFGISGQKALDIITAGFQQGGDYSGELLDTIREYSPQFASLGLSVDQAMGMLVAGAQAGAWNLDKVGDAMKEFNIRAQDGSKTTAEGFTMLGLNADKMGTSIAAGGKNAQQAFMATITALANMKDPLLQNQAGVALFGTQWEDLRGKVVTAMADGVTGIKNFQGATAEAAKAAYDNNPGLILTMAMRELQAAIGPALLPLADIIKNTIAPAVKSLAEGFKNLSPAGQKIILVIAGIAAVIGPLLVVFGMLSTAISSIIAFLPGLGAAFAVLTGPIGIVIAAIAAFAAIAIVVIKNWGPIKAFFANLWNGIKDIFTTVLNAIKSFIENIWNGIKTVTETAWNAIKTFLVNWWPVLVGLLGGPIGVLVGLIIKNWDSIKSATETAWNAIKTAIIVPIENVKNLLSTAWNAIKTNIETIWNGLKASATTIWNNIKTAITTPIDTIKNSLSTAWNAIKTTAINAWDTLKSTAGRIFNQIKEAIISPFKNIRIPMPHFDFSVIYKTLAGIKFPIPKISVNWYAKGGIFTSPQIIGVGEAGPEAVIPLNKTNGIGGVTINMYGPVNVRDDQDILRISRELFSLQQQAIRAKGIV